MMDVRSEVNLQYVHPALVAVVRGALQAPQPFTVVCGRRSLDAEKKALASGNSKTLHSRHLPDVNGFARAVDVAALIAGKLDYAKGREEEVFSKIAEQIQTSANFNGVPIQWGGAKVGAWIPGVVSHFRDWGHFQLPYKQYP